MPTIGVVLVRHQKETRSVASRTTFYSLIPPKRQTSPYPCNNALSHQQSEIDREMLLVIGVHAFGVRWPVLKRHPSHCDLPPRDQSNVLAIHLPRIFARFAP
jgi:hypothetical protein